MRTRLLSLIIVLGPFACGEKGDEEATTTATTTAAATTATASTGGASTDGGDGDVTEDPSQSTTGSTGGEASADDSGGETAAPTTGAETGSGGETVDPSDTTDTGTSACPEAPLGPGDHTISLEHDGVMRSAILHVPPGVDGAAATPLVFNFHGFTMTAAQQVTFTGMNALADAEGFLVVYPDGLGTSWNAGACCGSSMSSDVDDVGFVRALHAHLTTQVCVDVKRVYSTGMSNGGFMSNRLACEAADLFAAVGPVSSVNGMDPCTPSRPVPVIAFNGTDDILVSYDGLLYIGVQQSFAEWGARDGCAGAPEPGPASGAASCETYTSCADGVQVSQCTIEGMGHCWPGNPVCLYGAANTDMDANAEMWAFFAQYALP